jgi:hypothetical protein
MITAHWTDNMKTLITFTVALQHSDWLAVSSSNDVLKVPQLIYVNLEISKSGLVFKSY